MIRLLPPTYKAMLGTNERVCFMFHEIVANSMLLACFDKAESSISIACIDVSHGLWAQNGAHI